MCDNGKDDGNGCTLGCGGVAVGWTCNTTLYQTSVCYTIAGDGLLKGEEECDDTNLDDGDGCSATMATEVGYSCIKEPSVCELICGDGLKIGPEVCDDGNSDDGDGCDSIC